MHQGWHAGPPVPHLITVPPGSDIRNPVHHGVQPNEQKDVRSAAEGDEVQPKKVIERSIELASRWGAEAW